MSVDNTDKEHANVLPESSKFRLCTKQERKDYAALTADNHPLGNVFGFSENFF